MPKKLKRAGRVPFSGCNGAPDPSDIIAARPKALIAGGNIGQLEQIIVAAASRKLLASVDQGQTWYEAKIPSYVTKLNSVGVDSKSSTIWIATREVLFTVPWDVPYATEWRVLIERRTPFFRKFSYRRVRLQEDLGDGPTGKTVLLPA